MSRDYEASPVADSLGLRDVVLGLVRDMEELRAGRISPADALARANLAKQVFNGVRLYVTASRFLEQGAQPVAQIGEPHDAR